MPDIHQWIEVLGQFYGQYGYPLVFLGTLAENTALLGLLLPGNSLALLGAFYARQGTLGLGWVILLAWLGTVLGYHVDYVLGRFVLERVALRWSTTPLGRRLRLAGRLRLARRLLARHGAKAILLSHLVGHIRSFVALSAGATRMRYRTFLVAELVAALLWSTAFCLLGYFVGGERARLEALMTRFGWGVLLVVIALVVLWHFFGERLRAWWHAHRAAGGRFSSLSLGRRAGSPASWARSGRK
ncbi:MAG TPA: DedA family protein [Ktedonobacterales bacterium]